jgi:hypothetical protein
MAYKITERGPRSKRIVAVNFADAEQAKAYLGGNSGKIVVCEEDSDNPGFYDVFMTDGRILAIEPANEEST